MTSFQSFDWENMQSTNISSLDENDFMMLLQKQFPIVGDANNGTNDQTKSNTDTASTTAPGATKFQVSSTTSPLSSDSSPSPPSARDDDASLHSADGNNANKPDDESHKRKASGEFDAEIRGQPNAKSQHMETNERTRKAVSSARRKSTGADKDESRLLKRKEQNRAAQRAFRERKEKHVKDLEDRVAQLEAKTETQAAENENLRDMLGRLQNENTMLKQATFTFSVPNSMGSDHSRRQSMSTPTTSISSPLNMFSSGPAEAGPSRLPATSNAPSTHDSPAPLFDRFDNFTSLSPAASAASPSSRSNTAPAAVASSSPDVDTLNVFGSTGPFTTISSNPMFMSYYDPIQSMNAFASFGGWDNDVSMTNATGSSTGLVGSQGGDNSGLDGLFGDQLAGLIPLAPDFLNDKSPTMSGASPSNAGGASPVAHHGSASSPNNAAHNSGHNHNECPKTKEDVERLIANGPKGTFGSPVSVSGKDSNGGNAMMVEPNVNEYEVAFQEALGKAKPPHVPPSYNIDELCLEMQRKAKCTMGDC